ncbi:MAG: phytanoyl-CoA dioxygenase family protein [Imperialibacter sp.]|uniref:phytanoyl-CoA dioxygenase family protein n=1 Tax=Imperialibacter sp. TaxID=2038411 RepID=UPI0032EADFAA
MSSVADLAGVHELVSRLFEWPETEKEWEQYKLSDEQVAFFKENGYLANVKLLNSMQVESLRNELEEIADPNHPGHHLFYEFHSNESADPSKVLFHALGAWRVTPGFHDVLWNPAFVMAASQLLGGSVRFWHDQLFCKPAKHGGVVAWHQDYSYWTRTKPMEHLTCWVGLDDADVDNGCLYYVPGSHRWGLLDKPDLAGDMNGLDQYLTEEQKSQFNPIPIEMKMGHGTFHHPLLVHGSYENKTDRQRRAYVTNVFKDGTRSDADTPLLTGADVVPQGQKMEGKFFPLLYRA